MLTVLTVITFIVALVYVVVLAVTLILVAVRLTRAAGTAAKLAAGLEAVQGHTQRLPEYLTTINGALVQLRGGLQSVDAHFGRILSSAGLKEKPESDATRGEVAGMHDASHIQQQASSAGGAHITGEAGGP